MISRISVRYYRTIFALSFLSLHIATSFADAAIKGDVLIQKAPLVTLTEKANSLIAEPRPLEQADLDFFITTVQSHIPADLFSANTSQLMKKELIDYCAKNIKPFSEGAKILRSMNDYQSAHGYYLKNRLPELSKKINDFLALLAQGKVYFTRSVPLNKATVSFCQNIDLEHKKKILLSLLSTYGSSYLTKNYYDYCVQFCGSLEYVLNHIIENIFDQKDRDALIALSNLYIFKYFQLTHYEELLYNLSYKIMLSSKIPSIDMESIKSYVAQGKKSLAAYLSK